MLTSQPSNIKLSFQGVGSCATTAINYQKACLIAK